MNKYLQQIKSDIDLPLIKKSIIFAVLFGFIVHGSNFFNPVYCHDSLQYFYQDTDVFWKISLGRFMQALTIPLRDYESIPLISGTLSLLFIGLSSYVIAKTLDIKSRVSIYLISALIITSISYITASLLCFHELDPFMLAVLFASVGVYIFNKFRLGYIVAALPIALCCGLYQPYMSVAIMLLMILIIKDILNGVHSRDVLQKSIKAISTLVLAGVTYLILYKTVLVLADISTPQTYNNVDNILRFDFVNIAFTLFSTYWNAIKYLFFPYAGNLHLSSFIVNTLIFASVFILFTKKIIYYKAQIVNSFILLIILLLIPLSINIATFLSSGVFHELMLFSTVLIYVLFLMIIDVCSKKIKFAAYLLLIVLVFNGASFVNRVYVDIEIFNKNSHSLTFDIYKELMINNKLKVDNNMPIAIVGHNTSLQMFYNKYMETSFFAGRGILFLHWSYCIFPFSSSVSLAREYYKFHYKTDLNFVALEKDRDFTLDEELNSMPVYPAEGYMKCVRDTIFIRFPMEPQNFGANK